MEASLSQLDLQNHDLGDSMHDDTLHDDTSVPASALRFSVGNMVIYKSEFDTGWFEGEVVKVNQRARLSSDDTSGTHVAYVIERLDYYNEEEVMTELVLKDTDDFIRPRPDDLTPNPAKSKPLLPAPDDPHYYLYTDAKMSNYNYKGGPVLGADPHHAMLFVTNHLSVREQVGSVSPIFLDDWFELLKSIDPGTSLAQLEEEAKSSSSKMRQLADCVWVGLHGWRRDLFRAYTLYCAAAYGCAEEDMLSCGGVPVGDPKAMITVASLAISHLKDACGYSDGDQCPFHELIDGGMSSDANMAILYRVFRWLTFAMRVHGHVSSLTLMIGKSIKEMNFISDRRLVGEEGQCLKHLGQKILQAFEYRERELHIIDMQEKGLLPRGDPSEKVIQLFKSHALDIFQSLPKSDDNIHIEFKQLSQPPFPMIAISFLPTKRKFVKIVRLSESLQLTPFSLESFEHVWLHIAFDIHLGKPGSKERCRPKVFTVVDDGHGNRAFALYMKKILERCDTKVRLVAHSDVIKTGRSSRSTLGDLVSKMMMKLRNVPGFGHDDESQDDIVVRAQEDHVDHLVSQLVVIADDGESNVDASHLQAAEMMKQRGNEHFQARDFSSANRCYSLGIGHLRRIIKHNQLSYELLGTTLSNRAACFIALIDAQRSSSTEFLKVYARNAMNDCTTALESSWASSSLPQSILDKLRFRRDKAAAIYDELNVFPTQLTVVNESISNIEVQRDDAETNRVDTQQGSVTGTEKNISGDATVDDALVEYGEVLHENHLAKNANDGCPICLREFDGELVSSFSVVLPCGEHALCASCTCTLKIQADKAKQCPQCPLCRFSFSGDFVEGIPSVIIEKDQMIANLIVQLTMMDHNEKIAVAERLLWTHRFDVAAVADAIEELLDGRVNGLFFRSEDDLTHRQKEDIYRRARIPVEKLEEKLRHLLADQSSANSKALVTICCEVRHVRKALGEARERAREDIYSRMNTVGTMGAELESGMIQVDYHGQHVNGLRKKFKDHIIPIIPAVGKVMVITGRGSHSVGKESKLKKALIKLIEEYKNLSWQRVERNEGAILVLWKSEK